MKKMVVMASVAIALLASCSVKDNQMTQSGLLPQNFESVQDGDSTHLYTLKNKAGMEVCITNFGGRIVSIMVPDKTGKMQDVVLGFDSVGQYVRIPSDFGAAIGRYANRIDHGLITVDGKKIQLPVNNFGHCLHGGPKGWQYKVYQGKQLDDQTLQLTMVSPDGDMNFPGKVTAIVTYKLTDDNSIDIKYSATTDKTTVINMTNHSYFNLNGDASQPITNNLLYINAKSFTPVDSTFMTNGDIVSVFETPLDFTKPTVIGKRIDDMKNQQIKNAHGYDHNWVLNSKGDLQQVAARLSSPVTGIVLEVYTTEPGIQVYSGNFLDGTVKGKKGITYQKHAAICLESQHYPDSPNKPQWPSAYLKPGQTYSTETIFKFSTEK